MPEQLSPQIKDTLIKYLSVGFAEYIESTLPSYFDNPKSPESREIMLAGVAEALRQVTANDPTARATLRAFALELLETE